LASLALAQQVFQAWWAPMGSLSRHQQALRLWAQQVQRDQ
jgi:hypothetical protein